MNLILAVILVGSPAGIIPPDNTDVVDLIKQNIQAASLSEVMPAAEPQPQPEPEPQPVPAPQQQGYSAATAVADCESGEIKADGTAIPYSYSLTAENPVSSASGKYQFISSTWTSVTGLAPPASAYPEHVQDQAFHTLWDNGNGSFHWNPSRYCWERMLP